MNDRDYTFSSELPGFDTYQDGTTQYRSLELDDGRFIVVTDLDGMGLPDFGDFMACIYASESAWFDGEHPLACADSTQFETITLALDTIENVN